MQVPGRKEQRRIDAAITDSPADLLLIVTAPDTASLPILHHEQLPCEALHLRFPVTEERSDIGAAGGSLQVLHFRPFEPGDPVVPAGYRRR